MTKKEQIESLLQTVNSQSDLITDVIDKYNRLDEAFSQLLENSILSDELKTIYLDAAYGKYSIHR